MGSVYDYLDKYGDMLFSEKKFNDIDGLILSCLSYLEFGNIVPNNRNYITLFWALKELCTDKNRRLYNNRNSTQKETFYVAKVLMNKKRYQNILLYNYEYKVTFDEQFSALTMKLDDGTIFVSFEGTDNNIVGWEEDTKLVYNYPNQNQIDATKYLDRSITIFDKKVIVGGHSKGGHLALIASMNLNIFDRDKIVKIYSIDGLGLRKENINSLKYEKVESKLKLIVPNYSIVGMLLRHTNDYIVAKSSRKGFYAHCPFYWEIDDDKLVTTELSSLSKKLDESVSLWLNDHNDEERKRMCSAVFDIFRECNITKTNDILKAKNLFPLIHKSIKLDKETKDIIKNFIKFNVDYIKNNK